MNQFTLLINFGKLEKQLDFMENLDDFKKFAKTLADESGKIIKQFFRSNLVIENKFDSTPVTIADKKAEEIMRELIMKKYPKHGIVGEEFGNYNESAEYKWVLDPIDGTKSFICGTVTFGTLIALLKNDRPILGIINQPILNEFLIGDNFTCELNGQIVKTRECKNLSEAVLLVTDHLDIGKFQNAEKFDKLIKKVKLYRNWGDCYGYYLLATGYADIMLDPIMSPWDILALIPIIKGAGGIITDFNGNDAVVGKSCIATVKEINKEVMEILK